MGYVIVGAIIGAFVGVCFAIAKREGKAKEALEAQLTYEQKERLMNTEVNFVEESAWIQEAIVAKMVEKGSKFDIRLLWYNKTLGGDDLSNKFTIADASLKKAEQQEHDVKVGDIVKLYMAPEKTIGSVKIVF